MSETNTNQLKAAVGRFLTFANLTRVKTTFIVATATALTASAVAAQSSPDVVVMRLVIGTPKRAASTPVPATPNPAPIGTCGAWDSGWYAEMPRAGQRSSQYVSLRPPGPSASQRNQICQEWARTDGPGICVQSNNAVTPYLEYFPGGVKKGPTAGSLYASVCTRS